MAANGIYLERELYKSEAFKKLSKAQVEILFLLMERRIINKQKTPKGKRDKKNIINNGEIIFTYKEAEKLKYSRRTFANAISRLVEVGLVDIAHLGNGSIKGDCSKYGFYDRWKKYGRPDFVKKKRDKDSRRSHSFDDYNKSRKKRDVKPIDIIQNLDEAASF